MSGFRELFAAYNVALQIETRDAARCGALEKKEENFPDTHTTRHSYA